MAFRCFSQRVFSTAFKSRNPRVPYIKPRSPPTLQRRYRQMYGEKKQDIGDEYFPDSGLFVIVTVIGVLTGAHLSRKFRKTRSLAGLKEHDDPKG